MNKVVDSSPIPQPLEVLPDLGFRFAYQGKLGAGANDRAYIVTEGDKKFVALTPINPSDNAWEKLKGKVRRTEKLKQVDGLAPFLVDEVAIGTHWLDTKPGRDGYGKVHTPKKVVVVEYAGAPIRSAPNDETKILLVKQMWECLQLLHQGNYYISDFKSDHFTFISTNVGLQLKMIDYTGIAPLWTSSELNNSHLNLDLGKFMGITESLFPWFTPPENPPVNVSYEEHKKAIERNLLQLGQQSNKYSPMRKAVLAALREVRNRTVG